jgi:ATP-binding cassette subfamily G (WHITE) protein 2 (SNQ2)
VLKELVIPAAGSKPPSFEETYASSYTKQFREVMLRLFIIYWRDVKYQFAKFAILLFQSLVYGLTYLQLDDSDEAGISSKIGSIYASVGFISVMQASYSMPFVLRMRAVFYRERSSNMYEPSIYSTALGLLEIPYVAASTTVFVTPMYFMIGYAATGAAYCQFWLTMFLVGLYWNYLGQLFASLSPNMQVSDIFASMSLDLIHLFAGVLIQFAAMPVGWQWFYCT